jgi:hypothetical protein
VVVRLLARLLHDKGPRSGGLRLASLLCIGMCGCTNTWDEISRKDISFGERCHNIWAGPQDPMVVLRDSKDGDDRAKALARLEEPLQHGGSAQEQDTVLKILMISAQTDTQAVCRVAAIQTLGKFKDPRAISALVDAYYKATTFTSDTATIVQCNVLTALGESHNSAAVDLLTRVVRAPEAAQEAAGEDKQQEQDRRLAAARALGNFSHYQAAEALLAVLKTEKDVGIRQTAHDSLAVSTGKDLGYDVAAWDKLLNEHAYDAPVPKPGTKDSKISLVGHSEAKQ